MNIYFVYCKYLFQISVITIIMSGARKLIGIKSKSVCNAIISLKGKFLINYVCHSRCKIGVLITVFLNTFCPFQTIDASIPFVVRDVFAPWMKNGIITKSSGLPLGPPVERCLELKNGQVINLEIFHHTDNSKYPQNTF